MTTYGRYPITMVRGEGTHLWDDTGKEYIDFVAGISTCCLGHAHPALAAAVTKQINTVHHVSNLYYIPQQGKLAEWLVRNSPADRAFFCNSGAEANEAAIKLARKHASTVLGLDDPVIITALNSFHGRTLGALSATGQEKYQKGFGPLVPGFTHVPYNDIDALRKCADEITQSSSAGRGVAAIMLEALQGEGGIRPGDKDFFKEARKICDETGALLICDEVQVGMGRTGELWGFENTGVEPDVFTLAKALGAGVPIGCMMSKASCAVFEAGDHASTYGGNPLACAAGLAVTHAIDNDGLIANVVARGAQLKLGLEELIQEHPRLLKEARGWGLIQGLEISEDSGVTAGQMVGAAIEEGLLLVPAGTHVVRFVPPLVVTEDDVTEALTIIKKVIIGFEKASDV
uniref:acetylornithine transaminase n=1 Tax=Octactis speculum TaxID=3111310 RepID=A0A7S2CEB1_9STRA